MASTTSLQEPEPTTASPRQVVHGCLCVADANGSSSEPQPVAAGVFEAATNLQPIRLLGEPSHDIGRNAPEAEGRIPKFLANLRRADPGIANGLTQALTRMPKVGEEFLRFRLISELGHGAFARVYLAEQPTVGNRQVVLKVTPNIEGETRTLAQLQHTNVVPIYSVHRATPLQAVCMPYFGSTTLATILKDLSGRESLPASGKGLVSTLVDRQSTTREPALTPWPKSSTPSAPSSLPGAEQTSETEAEPDAAAKTVSSNAVLEMLGGFTYVEAVLWIVARLADGLAHAHEQGILHRDLKPANILLTDHGQPMLLDFNLAQDTKLRYQTSAALVGGTLPYMAPEQLEAYGQATCTLNPNSDVYSLGVILYELLTGRHPFPDHRGEADEVLQKMIEDRLQPAPRVRPCNRSVSPSVESIVRHCLEPDPSHRYQTARELQEDLERQLEHLPLKNAPEPSLRERGQKWMRRHPRLASSTTVGVMAGVVVLLMALAFVYRSVELKRLEAADQFRRLQEDLRTGQFLMTTASGDQAQIERGITFCRETLDRYGVVSNPDWLKNSVVKSLPAQDQDRLRGLVADCLLLMARVTTARSVGSEDATQRAKDLQAGIELNRLAERCLGEGNLCHALVVQRAEFARREGKLEDEQSLRKAAERIPLRTSWDRYLVAREYIFDGRHQDAVPLFEGAVQQDPQNYWAWFGLGLCRDGLAQDAEAVACYSACVALWPQFERAYFNRGLAFLRQRQYERARHDFDQVIKLKPKLTDAYINRAIAKQGLEKYTDALEDLNAALALGTEHTRVYYMRAKVRDRLKDAEGAKRDRAEALRREPYDEKDWISRGLARSANDPPGALADFAKALELNPRSLAALQNKAYVLSRENRNEEAVQVLDRIVSLYPNYVPSRASRGVLLARLKKTEAAYKDAQDALDQDGNPATAYLVAGVYALTSRDNPADRQEAYRLLSYALRRGFGFDEIEKDRDLDYIRQQPEFRRLVEAAKALQDAPRKSAGK
jgi:eukaryotic-like serine/threonine-protein kinase